MQDKNKNRLKKLFGRKASMPKGDDGPLAPSTKSMLLDTTSLTQPKATPKQVWNLIKPYWTSRDAIKGGLMFGAIFAMGIAQVKLNVAWNSWYSDFTNAMTAKNGPEIYHQLEKFCEIAAPLVALSVVKPYVQALLNLDWRSSMTDHYTNKWLTNKAFSRIATEYRNIDNPDQRIADDLASFPALTNGLVLGGTRAAFSVFEFGSVLWTMSQGIAFDLPHMNMHIHGPMFWSALAYTAMGTAANKWVGRKLPSLNQRQQKVEADYRYTLMRLRENAKTIALYKGEEVEKHHLRDAFDTVKGNIRATMRLNLKLDVFQSGYGQVAVLMPYMIALPVYLSTKMTFGALNQTADAFGSFQGDLGWFIDSFSTISAWKGVTRRLTSLDAAIEQSNRDQVEKEMARPVLPPASSAPADQTASGLQP